MKDIGCAARILSLVRSLVLAAVVGFSLLAATSGPSLALTVTQPTASTVTPAGDDYATQVLGNAWDMNDPVDLDTEESLSVTSQTISGGVYSGTSTTVDPNLYPLFPGYASSINLSRGANFPIDTSHYRYVTMKIRLNGSSGRIAQVFFYQQAAGSFGFSNGSASLPNNQFVILTFDMIGDISGSSPNHWTDFTQVQGLRIDPAVAASVGISIDWIRLTAPATSAEKTLVQWSDSGYSGTYNITAIDSGGISYILASGVSGFSYQADTSFLTPGAYTIQVARTGGGGTTANSQTFRINSPPQPALTAPSVRGEQSQDFATTVAGDAWGPFSATDFSTNGVSQNGIINFSSHNFTTYPNSFYGRPGNSDPEWFLNLHAHAIDTNIYRSLCFKQEVFGPRGVGTGSVARVFWGNSTAALTTSDDIPLDDNQGDSVVGEYCVPDLAAANVIDPTAPQNGGTWSGTKAVFRLDPSEWNPSGCNSADTCHDIRLDSVTLSPFAHANPTYTFKWTLADADDPSAVVNLYLDPDTTPDNGNEILIHSENASTGNGQFTYTGSGLASSGTYHALIVADDGSNAVSQYAGGPIIVTTPDQIFTDGFE